MQYIKYMIAISLFIHPFAAVSQSKSSFKVVAEVNDQIITNFEVDQRIKMLQTFGAKSISRQDIMNSLIN